MKRFTAVVVAASTSAAIAIACTGTNVGAADPKFIEWKPDTVYKFDDPNDRGFGALLIFKDPKGNCVYLTEAFGGRGDGAFASNSIYVRGRDEAGCAE